MGHDQGCHAATDAGTEHRSRQEREDGEALAREQDGTPGLADQELAQGAEAELEGDLRRGDAEGHDAEQHGGTGEAAGEPVGLSELLQADEVAAPAGCAGP